MDEFRDFGWALVQLRDGKKLSRQSWRGRNMWIALQKPDKRSKMKQSYIYMNPGNRGPSWFVPYTPTQEDLLAQDWGFTYE